VEHSPRREASGPRKDLRAANDSGAEELGRGLAFCRQSAGALRSQHGYDRQTERDRAEF
jgi:hypothetical protein